MRNKALSRQEDMSEKYLLQQQINTLRETLVSAALKKGMTNHTVLSISEELDRLIFQYQQLNAVKKAT
ncbi:aspartyl-phosphate phosphatase Spo0E family protein [Bacillus sp. B1-b2]|uniref:aspartyl-phosphate phosphatase Spo0E family protein n=1 Tax=Bacillus sp. B1-b2 TaxID=2653201 RepID=UPI001D01D6C6|nr:aspartyl-phosphate phosphatase Spo0E family protein [Bacillus sp. B1-b2]